MSTDQFKSGNKMDGAAIKARWQAMAAAALVKLDRLESNAINNCMDRAAASYAASRIRILKRWLR